MQNNVTELTQRLLRALDNNYNVIDMPAVIEIVSLLEKVSITKELLETTRLGKHVNELRRKTDNDSLSKRAKELVKKWRNMVLPESNGQLKSTPAPAVEDDSSKAKKRPAKEPPDGLAPKRPKINGQMNELDFSDNSNSSFKDVITSKLKRDVILINSDSNSSLPEPKQEPHLEQQLPKKRGRKKGSKNHKNLLDEAESSFSNKLAVSRGNSKVKTTQELIAGLQNKNNSVLGVANAKPKEDLKLRAAKLTERVSIIDQKLNTNANRYKNSQRRSNVQKAGLNERNERVIESGSVINDKSLILDEEIIVVDDVEPSPSPDEDVKPKLETEVEEKPPEEPENKITSLSVEEALAQLPPIDRSVLDEEKESPACTCTLKEVREEESEVLLPVRYELIEDPDCLAKSYFSCRYQGGKITPEELHSKCVENVNGNYGIGSRLRGPEMTEEGLYVNVVPIVNSESIPKDIKPDFSGENYKRYSISERGEGGDEERTGVGADDNSDKVFREWHEVLDTPSYNGEIFKILPYVIID